MCGRFSLAEDIHILQEQFQFEISEEIRPRYNVAPSQKILTVVSDEGHRTGKTMRWGLVPYWADDIKIGYKMINARGESVDEKASFKHAFKKRRCLILADGFYEWEKKSDGTKQPFRFIMKNKQPFAMAGLFEMNSKVAEEPVVSCTIITTTPNKVTEKVHDRMPVILKEEDYDMWLNPSMNDTEFLKTLIKPYEAEQMDAYLVSTLVNSPKNDLADILSPLNSI